MGQPMFLIQSDGMSETIDIAIEEYLIGPDLGIEYIKHSQHGIIAVNDKRIIILANRSAELMFGYHKAELLGKPIEVLLPDALREKHQHHTEGFVTNPRNRPMGVGLDLKAKKKDGTEMSVDINLIPVPSVNGLITMAEISKK